MPPAKPSTKPRPSPELQHTPANGSSGRLEVVDPIWLLKALALSFLAALFCVWLTFCLLFYQGEWQLVLQPSRTVDRTPSSLGLPFEDVHFDAAVTGQPRLTAWWIPAQSFGAAASAPTLQTTPRYAAYTILYLHDGSGSLANTLPTLLALHQAGINLFAIDYRSFGLSDPSAHPSEARMTEDTVAALAYLTQTRHISAARIVPYGAGLGTSLAVNLAHAHPEIPAVILDNANPDPTATALSVHSSHLLPVHLLFRERFDIATPLATLTTPKLQIVGGQNYTNTLTGIRALESLYHGAASPHLTVTLPTASYEKNYQATLTRFLDQYLHPGGNH